MTAEINIMRALSFVNHAREKKVYCANLSIVFTRDVDDLKIRGVSEVEI